MCLSQFHMWLVGPATFHKDNSLESAIIIITPNHKRGSISFDLTNDQESEADEDILIKMLSPQNAKSGEISEHQIYLRDDSLTTPVITFTQ